MVQLVCESTLCKHNNYNFKKYGKQFASQNHNELTLCYDNLIYSSIYSTTKFHPYKEIISLTFPIHYIHCPLQDKYIFGTFTDVYPIRVAKWLNWNVHGEPKIVWGCRLKAGQQTDPTLLANNTQHCWAQQCCDLLHPFALNHNNVGTCCI